MNFSPSKFRGYTDDRNSTNFPDDDEPPDLVEPDDSEDDDDENDDYHSSTAAERKRTASLPVKNNSLWKQNPKNYNMRARDECDFYDIPEFGVSGGSDDMRARDDDEEEDNELGVSGGSDDDDDDDDDENSLNQLAQKENLQQSEKGFIDLAAGNLRRTEKIKLSQTFLSDEEILKVANTKCGCNAGNCFLKLSPDFKSGDLKPTVTAIRKARELISENLLPKQKMKFLKEMLASNIP